MRSRLYSTDLAFIHDVAFGDFARHAAPGVVRMLQAAGIAAGVIVEAGCGSGILAAQLVAAGYDVLGIDQSAAMIRLARANAPAARFRVASLAHAAIPPCRAIIAAGEVITYVGRREAGAFFKRVQAALEPHGVLIFDFIESAERRTYSPRPRHGDGWSLVASADLNASGRILTRRLQSTRQMDGRRRRSSETHRVRIYPRDEMARMLRAAGFAFTMRRSYGRYKLLPGDVVVIARKACARKSTI